MTSKMWNWKLKRWPHFTYDKEALQELEYQFFENNGTVIGVLKHIKEGDIVRYDKHAGHGIEWNDIMYYVITINDIVLVE